VEQSAFERWELPHVNDESRRGSRATAGQLESLQKQAYEEGFSEGREAGFRQGLEQGAQEVQQRVEYLAQLIEALNTPFEALDEQVIEQTAQLALAVAQQLVRRELKADPEQLVGVVREAVSILPVSARNIRVFLHPDDAGLLREALSLGGAEDDARVWQIVEDPLISRGGCRVSAENSMIDATLEKRLQRMVAGLLGGERATDGQHAAD
jgi:flagellar assembly protein FliH